MTIKEIQAAVTPKTSNLGAVSGGVNIDLALYNDISISIGANVTANFENLSSSPNVTYLVIAILHTSAGTTITNLTGVFDSEFAWGTHQNDITLLTGRYDGTNWFWSSSIFLAAALSAPGSFSGSPSDGVVALTWDTVANATNYLVDAATDSGFTTNVRAGIYSGSGTSFSDTELSNGTHYYYRVKAQASGFSDSSYSFTDSTPTADNTGFLTWNSIGIALETYNTGHGIRKTSGAGAGWANSLAWSNQQLTPGHTLTIIFDVVGYIAIVLNSTRVLVADGNAVNLASEGIGLQYIADPISFVSGGSLADSTTSIATGTQIRFVYAGDGSTIDVESSEDSGSTWVTINNYSVGGSPGVYFGVNIYGNNDQVGLSSLEIV